MDQIKDGIYFLRAAELGVRRVRVDAAFIPQGGLVGAYYRFVGDDDQPLPYSLSMSVMVALQSGAAFEMIEQAGSEQELQGGESVTAGIDVGDHELSVAYFKNGRRIDLPVGYEVTTLRNRRDEVIRWHDVAETTPDDGMIVLLNIGDYESEPVWPGYLEGGTWFWADASEVQSDVIAWAEMPVGPKLDDECGCTADLVPTKPVLSGAVAKATAGIGFGEGLRNG